MHRLIPEAINPIFIDRFPESISEEIGGAEGEKRISAGDGAAAGSSERREEWERRGKMKK